MLRSKAYTTCEINGSIQSYMVYMKLVLQCMRAPRSTLEQQVFQWYRHETNSSNIPACCIPNSKRYGS